MSPAASFVSVAAAVVPMRFIINRTMIDRGVMALGNSEGLPPAEDLPVRLCLYRGAGGDHGRDAHRADARCPPEQTGRR